MIATMAEQVIHIPEKGAKSDFASLLERARAGSEIDIEWSGPNDGGYHAAQPESQSGVRFISLLLAGQPLAYWFTFRRQLCHPRSLLESGWRESGPRALS